MNASSLPANSARVGAAVPTALAASHLVGEAAKRRTILTLSTVAFTLMFAVLIFIVGCGMGIGKAAVYKYIPEYFPHDVGAVGGLVGLLGALGGFFLPPLFAYAYKGTGIPQTTFAILFLVTLVSFAWLHWVVYRLMRRATPHLRNQFEERK